MKRQRSIAVAAIAAAAGLGLWSWAQTATPSISAMFPAGAVLYLEAKDFGALLGEWDASKEKAAWLKSDNYKTFATSRLLQRLEMEQDQFAQAAGLPPDYALLKSGAGTDSALAIYDIGNLELLYISRIGGTRGAQSALYQARGTFQSRNVAGKAYFVKTDATKRRTVAFALVEDLLIAGTREDLVSGAIQLMSGQQRPALRDERWFVTASAAQTGARDLRLVMNLARLVPSQHYRSYYLHNNQAEMKSFVTGIADLERAAGEWRESRAFLRQGAEADLRSREAAVARLMSMVPDDASLYRAWAAPEATQVSALITSKFLLSPQVSGSAPKSAPVVDLSAENVGSEDQLETRIDETIQIADRTAGASAPVAGAIAANAPAAVLQLGWSVARQGSTFPTHEHAVVLMGSRDWDAAGLRNALGSAARNLWTVAGAGAEWQGRDVQTLSGLVPLAVAVQGPVAVISTSAARAQAVIALASRPAGAGASYAAGVRHARERANFARITSLIDFPRLPVAEGEAREPFLFSENIVSLSRSLARLDSIALEEHDDGAVVRQRIVYKMTP